MNLSEKTQAELREVRVLNRTSIFEVINLQIELFEITHGSKPQVIFLSSLVRTAFTKELIQRFGMPPDAAICEPMWIDQMPILYSKKMGDDFIQLINQHTKKELSL